MNHDDLVNEYDQGIRDFTGVTLDSLYFEGVALQRSNLTAASLQKSIFSNANLAQANLRKANLNKAFLTNANLEQANLYQASLIGAELTSAKLQKSCLEEANLEGAVLDYANLSAANLRKANLRNASLEGADLSNANLTGACLQGANFEGAILTGTCLERTIFQGTSSRALETTNTFLNELQETKKSCYSRRLFLLAILVVICIVSPTAFDSTPPHIAYCIRTLEKAANAETIGIAKEALKDGSLCIEYNYSQDSSEYHDIQSSSRYLLTQPNNIPTPQFIKNSLTKLKKVFVKDFVGEGSPLDTVFIVFLFGSLAVFSYWADEED